MLASVTGTVARVLEEEVRLQVGPFELQVKVPDITRRQLATRLGETVTLHTLCYLDTNGNRSVPNLVGFLSEPEIEFFRLFCTVDGIGVKTALKAMVRTARDTADAIQRMDVNTLATLPGISASTAERVVAKLRKKVTRFALMVEKDRPADMAGQEPTVVEEAYQALLSVGHNDVDARVLLDRVLASGKKFKTSGDVLQAIYQTQA